MSDAPALSDAKRALLTERLRGKASAQQKKNAIPLRVNAEKAKLSNAQKGLWFLYRMAPESGAYNMPITLEIEGALDYAALEQAFNAVIHRHAILRSTFIMDKGEPTQLISDSYLLSIHQLDLRDLQVEVQNGRVYQIINEQASLPFDLEKKPPIRISLLQLDAQKHVLVVVLHHIVSDAWSFNVLMKEIAQLYETFKTGQQIDLPELSIQYADYAEWQRSSQQVDSLKQQLNFWKKQLDCIPILNFPTDKIRPAKLSLRGDSVPIKCSHHHGKLLKKMSQASGVTFFTAVLAVYYLLLHRYTGQKDLVTGTSIVNRNQSGTENLIGLFINTLVLRVNISGEETFNSFLARVDKMLMSAYAHQTIPFDHLVDALQVERSAARNPLFQVSIAFNNIMPAVIDLPGLKLTPLVSSTETSQFDLTLFLSEVSDELVGNFAYSTDLFERTTVERIARHFQNLLKNVVENPDIPLARLSMFEAHEQKQLLHNWNATEANYPQGWCIHEIFETQTEQNPHAIAVVFEDQQLTYGQLNAKANQLARTLRVRGVGPEVSVGICVERSLEMVIGILGILKAGGAYVPIDPKVPQERLMSILENTEPALVLTQKRLQGLFPPKNVELFFLDSEWDEVATERTDNVIGTISPDNLAYVLYTSGSTGKPKGVSVSHRNVVNATLARLDYYQQPIESFLWLSAMTFDSSIAGLFGTLSQGGRLVLPQDDAILDVKYLLQLITDHAVTHLLTVPSLYKALLGQIAPHQANRLKAAIVAGEACHPDLVEMHGQVLPQVALFNEYGPTEATVWCSVHSIQPRATQRTIPIGRPIANTQIYLLDDDLNPVPVGVTGELYIGGMGITRGYLNNPELTADRFVPDPYGQQTGARLYRTGDMARYRADGNIEYIGRTDHQIKIRGFRIELGEVEAALLQLEQVREAVAMVREDNLKNLQLVAYLVGNDQAPDIETVRTQLKTRLPDYMIPSAFVYLDSLPLTENGKIDRKALPAPDLSDQLTHEYVAPRNPIEAKLAEIWVEVLGVEKVGVHDNFFELGGHSMLVIKLVSRMSNALGFELEIQAVFERPTIAAQARLYEYGGVSVTGKLEKQIDLENESKLDLVISPVNNMGPISNDPAAIFLTGATGFLGSFLLYELLQQTSADIYCLVRADSTVKAFDKLILTLKKYEIYHETFSHKIVPVCGDLSQPLLGLPKERFEKLAAKIDVIYHNGALVNFIQPYAVLKSANVDGTREVLRLACAQKSKSVHYVSTLSVFSEVLKADQPGFSEDDPLDVNAKLSNGYGQSKWVAERLVNICAERGLPINIYRPATVTGHSQTGMWNTDDYLCRLIRGCIDLGEAPEMQVGFNIVPVDYVSKAIVALSREEKVFGKAYHLSNTIAVNSLDIVSWINQLGHSVKLKPYSQWRENMLPKVNQALDHPLYPLLSMFSPDTNATEDSFDDRVRYRCEKTIAALVNCEIQCPVPDYSLFKIYLTHLQNSKLL
ncbi:MAG TPA: amino acid adenylation domain-containing protein [Nitrosomonas sp.]|nr:amino acid adenylation domain-containing protein [Nitrosomonas sp.]